VLREVSDTLALAEQMDGVLVPVGGDGSGEEPAGRTAAVRGTSPVRSGAAVRRPASARPPAVAEPRRPVPGDGDVRQVATDGTVSVSVRQETPLKATLRATRRVRSTDRGREVVYAA
jgi:hypothetical protein